MAKLLKVRDVCEQLGVSDKTLYKMLDEHTITAYRLGGSWRFAQEDVDAYIERCRVNRVAPVAPVAPVREAPRPRRGRPVANGCGYVPGMKVV